MHAMGLCTESKLDFPMRWLCLSCLVVESMYICYTNHKRISSLISEYDSCSWKARSKVIYRATRQHAFNLAKFVTIYKTLLLVQKKMNSGKERKIDTFMAGLIGGYFVFGDRNAVNEQVCIIVIVYIFSLRNYPSDCIIRHL